MIEEINVGIIEDIFTGNHRCKCGRSLDASSIEYGDIEGIFKCKCGASYVLGDEEELGNIVEYNYGYDEGFLIKKITYFPKIDKNRCNYSEKSLMVEELCFKIGRRGQEDSKVIYKKQGQKERVPKDFFNKYSINDFRDTVKSLKSICSNRDIRPNYGEILEPLCIKRNMRGHLELFKLIFTSKAVELLIKEKLEYLILIDPVIAIKEFTSVVTVDEKAHNLAAMLGVPKKTVNYIRDRKLRPQKICALHNFFNERNYKEFKILFEEGQFSLSSLDNVRELLSDGYSAEKLYKYILKIRDEEKIDFERAIGFLNDLRIMSRDMEVDFRPYSKNLRERHDKLQEKYSIQKDQLNSEKLEEKFKDFKIEQVGEIYYSKLLKSVEDFKKEGEAQRNCVLSYVKRAINEDLFVFSIRKCENLEKPIITVEVKKGKIVQARSFANGLIDEEIRKYLIELGYKNGWKVARM